MNKLTFILSSLAAVALGISFAVLMKAKNPDLGNLKSMRLLDEPRALPELQLTSTKGEQGTKLLQGHWTLLALGFTSCPDTCPANMAKFNELMKDDRLNSLRFALLSVDPETDTPEILKEYVEGFHQRIVGFASEEGIVKKLAKSLATTFGKDFSTQSIYHSPTFYLINPNGQWVGYINPEENPMPLVKRELAVGYELAKSTF